MKSATVGTMVAALLSVSAAHAGQCVDAKSAKNGFILEKPGIHSEFRQAV